MTPEEKELLEIEYGRYSSDKQLPKIAGRIAMSPLTPDRTSASRAAREPPPMEFIANFRGGGFIKKGIVGMVVAAGGTGKTYWLMKFGSMLAAGETWGFIEPVKKLKVLMLCAEDDEETILHRLWNIDFGCCPDTFYIASVMGACGPIMDKTGQPTVVHAWIKETIDAHDGIDLLILDPKSRFFAGKENENDDNTRFVQLLENIALEKGCTILFSHHVTKMSSSEKELSSNMARGGGALADGVRFCLAASDLDEKEADAFGVNSENFIKMKLVKTNYTGKTGVIYFRRDDRGVPVPIDLISSQYESMGKEFLSLIAPLSGQIGRRDVERGLGDAKDIMANMKELFPMFRGRKSMMNLVDFCIEKDLIYEHTNFTKKKVIYVR